MMISSMGVPFLAIYQGPLYPTVLEPIIQTTVGSLCDVGLLKDTICKSIYTGIAGKGMDQLDLVSQNWTNQSDALDI